MNKKTAGKIDAAEPVKKDVAAKSKPDVAKRIKVVGGEPSEGATNDAQEKVKKPVFIDRALLRTDVKKRDAKPAIEAALAELAAALLAGEELVLPPLGKLKVVNSKDLAQGAKALTLKLRTMKTEFPDEV